MHIHRVHFETQEHQVSGGRSLAFPLSAWPSLAPGHSLHLLPRGGFSHPEEGSAVSRALVSLLTSASSVERMRMPASSGMFTKESVLFTSLGTCVLRLTGRKEKKENWFLELEGCSERGKRWEMKREKELWIRAHGGSGARGLAFWARPGPEPSSLTCSTGDP